MVFDHMFSLIDNLSFSKKEENNTGGAKHNKHKHFKIPSLDTAFLVVVVLITIITYVFIKIRKRLKTHYRKKYTTVELREVHASAPLAQTMKHIY